MRVLDVKGLGWGAAVVTIDDERILLVEQSLSIDERIEVLSCALLRA